MVSSGTLSEEIFYHDVLQALCEARVKFVIVGGVAVNLQGVPRFTADLDLAVPFERANTEALSRVMSSLGLTPRLSVRVEQLADEEVVRSWIQDRNLKAFTFQDVNDPLRQVDLVLDSPMPFAEIERAAQHISAVGLSLLVAAPRTLIAMKQGTGRAQDEADIDALERILEFEK